MLLRHLLLWTAFSAAGEPNPYLAQAKVFYQGVDYENCLKRVEQAARWDNTREELVEIEIYWGLCQFEDAQRTAAKHFSLALQLDPNVHLPPFTSPKVVDVFKSVASKMPKPEPAPAPKVAPVAAPPPVDVPRVVALVPPATPAANPAPSITQPPENPGHHIGAGSIGFGAAAVIALGTGISFGVSAQQAQNQASSDVFTSDARNDANRAYLNATVANVSYATAIGCAATAAVLYFLSGPKEEP